MVPELESRSIWRRGNDCTTPSRFKEEVGYLKVRSALANSNYCRFGETPGSVLDTSQ